MAEESKKSKTILHLTDYGAPYAGNFFASLSALEQLLRKQGDRAVYALPPRAKNRVWAQEMASQHEIHFLQNGGIFSYCRQVRRLLQQTNADILHEHFIHFSEKIAAWVAAKTCGHPVKTVLHLHNHILVPKNPLLRLPHMLYFRSVSRFVCCSESVASHLIADGAPEERVRIAENAISFDRLNTFDPDLRATLKLGESAKLALMFGYNYEMKGVDLAVNAVRLLREREGIPLSLAIVVSSSLDNVRSRICEELGLQAVPDWILLLPPREDVASYYHMADVFLSPSRQEGFCYALIEAAYCETPVLASEIDAQKDLALPKSAFFQTEDVAALSAALLRTLGQERTPSYALKQKQTAQQVTQRYALLRWAERVCAAYAEIV